MDSGSSISFMPSKCVDSFCINFDKVCEFIPFASSVTNIIDLCLKHIYCLGRGQVEGKELQDSYWSYIDKKDSLRCILLAIPILNIPVAIYYYFFKSENSVAPVNQSPVIQQLSPLDESLHQRLIQEAFGSEKWKEHSAGTIGKNEDTNEESTSLVDFINEIGEGLSSEELGEKIEKMLSEGLFVRILKDLTFENMGAILKSQRPESWHNGYSHFNPPDDQEPIVDAYWVWISKNPIEGSEGKTYVDQQKMAAELGYQDCGAREVVAGLVAEYSLSKTLCEVWARCVDTIRREFPVIVNLDLYGLNVGLSNPDSHMCVVLGFLRWRPAEVRSSVLG